MKDFTFDKILFKERPVEIRTNTFCDNSLVFHPSLYDPRLGCEFLNVRYTINILYFRKKF